MPASIQPSKLPTGTTGFVERPRFVRLVDSEGNDAISRPWYLFRIGSSAASTNAVLIAGAGCKVFDITGTNTTAAPLFVHFYDKAASAPVPGTDPIYASFAIPMGGMMDKSFSWGMNMATGLGMSISTDAGGTVAPLAGALIGFNILVGTY